MSSRNTLIASISGIRGIFGSGLSPEILVKYASAFAQWCVESGGGGRTVVVGRDARVTGDICSRIVTGTLASAGLDVVDAGLATTPTVEMAVIKEEAVGGIVFSASHNPAEWNALKLLNRKGEFLSPEEGARVLDLAEAGTDPTVGYQSVGGIVRRDFLDHHIEAILSLPFIEPGVIGDRGFRVVVDGVNSVGGVAVPALLNRLGIVDVTCVNCEPTGIFAHPAEPLPENLAGTLDVVREVGADIGIVVDPDADRLALIEPGGRYMSEELTQVLAADFMWRFRNGPFATNLSSSRAIEDVAARYGQEVYRSAVGEINVVRRMQEVGAVLGGEGNGGVILPDLHYGRDALVGVAMVLQHLAGEQISLSEVRESLPAYHIIKRKIEIGSADPGALLRTMAERYESERVDLTDGVKIDFDEGWVHMRRSNTEPIMRIYAEAGGLEEAEGLAARFVAELGSLALNG
ncbi:MAG: phosphoglucosamine mutase [Rhodothermia bacterium]|nr:phosphoglucosamine mutase [Rhodothermia bacterium]